MEGAAALIKALPTAATHPFAFVGYIVVVVIWGVLAWRRGRNKQLLSKIEKIPENQRLEAIRLEMGGVELKEGLSPKQWLKNRIRLYWLIAFLALCLVGVVVFVIARVEATKLRAAEASKNELVRILKAREEKIVAAIDEILKSAESSPKELEELWEPHSAKMSLAEIRTLKSVRADVVRINQARLKAIRENNLILAHELGNDANQLGQKVQRLIDLSSKRQKRLAELVQMFRQMSPAIYSVAVRAHSIEESRLADLNALRDQLDKWIKRRTE